MTIYSYSQSGLALPAPYVTVELWNVDVSLARSVTCKALLDTGADVTLVPLAKLKQIRVAPIGNTQKLSGLGNLFVRPYWVGLRFDRDRIAGKRVFAWSQGVMLIGRDILNQYCITFDGPQQEFTID